MAVCRFAWPALLAAGLLGCPSGKPLRGVEHTGTAARGAKDDAPKRGTCRGSRVDAWTPPGFCVMRVASGLLRPRHLTFASNGDLLVATRKGVVVLGDADKNGVYDEHEQTTIGAPDVSHQGIALSPDGRWLYVADSRAVRRMRFEPGARREPGAAEVVVPDVPLTVDHPYRTITFDAAGRLYLAVGSEDNLSPGGGAVIVRFTLPDSIPSGGIAFAKGERFAVGIRNAEALAWDHEQRLWAFVNGRDFLRPSGTDASFYLDHPGDWIFRLSERPGTFYGFPHCWVLGPSPWGERRDPASSWADPDANGGHDDAWCASSASVHQAAGALPAHTAPLGAVEYTGTLFPPRYKHAFFVTSHGSWNRYGKQRGRTILAVHTRGERATDVEIIAGERSADDNLHEGDWKERPVGIAQGPDGALYFTSDETGSLLRLGYEP